MEAVLVILVIRDDVVEVGSSSRRTRRSERARVEPDELTAAAAVSTLLLLSYPLMSLKTVEMELPRSEQPRTSRVKGQRDARHHHDDFAGQHEADRDDGEHAQDVDRDERDRRLAEEGHYCGVGGSGAEVRRRATRAWRWVARVAGVRKTKVRCDRREV